MSGTYAVFVDPQYDYTGNMTLTLYNMPDITGPISIDGAAVTSTITVPGQRARYTFTGTIGQNLTLGFTNVTITSVTISLLKPDGMTWAVTTVGTGGGSQEPMALPVTGTYTVLVDPNGLNTGSITVTLSSELTGSVTINAAPTTIALARPGQNARYTFAGTSGQQTTVRFTSNTIPSCSTVVELKPDGNQLTSGSLCSASLNLPTQTLPSTGTYAVTINPFGANTGSVSLQVTSP